MENNLVDVDYDYIDYGISTTYAQYIIFDSSFEGVECFIPKSQIDKIDEDNKVISIPEWLALDKGLI